MRTPIAITLLLLAAPAAARTTLPAACNDQQVWDAELGREVNAGVAEIVEAVKGVGVVLDAAQQERLRRAVFGKLLWRIVRSHIIGGDHNNAGVVPLKGVQTAEGRPALLFRSGFTPRADQPGSCVHALVHQLGVRHVVNLYAGEMHTADLERAEQKTVTAAGGTYFNAREHPEAAHWRETLREQGDARAAMKAVAELVNTQILAPGDQPPRGHVHVHCGGGMHRTGMVVGVVERCLNGAAMEKIERDYKKHVGWESAARPGGFEQDNLDFIAAFDCALLKVPSALD